MKRKIVNKKLYAGLIFSFCMIILFSIVLTAVGVRTIETIRNDYTYTIIMPESKIGLLKDVKTEFMTMRYRAANYVMNSGDSDYINNIAHKQYNDAMAAFMRDLQAYIQLNNEDTRWSEAIIAQSISDADQLIALITEYNRYAETVLDLSVNGQGKEADSVLRQAIPIAEEALSLVDEMIAASDENITFVSENVYESTDSSIVFLVTLATVLVSFSGILSYLVIKAISRYIDDLKEAEYAAEESSRLKSVFLANMSHEIRTPMNSIIGFSELALDDNISLRTKDYLDKIKSSSEGLLQIINDVLDSSKIEAGKMVLEYIPFSLGEVFRACQIIIAPKARDKGITLFCYEEPTVDKMLLGDPTKLRQVLLNLLSNAVKFTNVGIVKLMSDVQKTSEDSVTVHFEVKDSGIGMTAEQISKIFEPFMQADDSTTRKFGGTGLGLSITKNIIEIMGGELVVESTPGVGSKFSFDLVFKIINTPMETPVTTIESKQIAKPVFDRGEVLVCEDNSMNQQVIFEHLTRVGLRTTIAVNGREGVEHVSGRIKRNEEPFGLIFMDIHMPVMDGLEAAEELNRIGNKTPIVALTANIMPNDRETYKQLGMSDCLAKPFTNQELWSCLTKYFVPVKVKKNKGSEDAEDEKLHNQLLYNFWQDNQTTYRDIMAALERGDIKVAHRLAHTLKSVAGLIGKTSLQESAQIIEHSLAGGKSEVSVEQLKVLELELSDVLDELSKMPRIAKPQTQARPVYDKDRVCELISRLEPLLSAGNTDCLDMIEELECIPDSGKLIEEIESFRFTEAVQTLAEIKTHLDAEAK